MEDNKNQGSIQIGDWLVHSEHSMIQSVSLGRIVELECMAIDLLMYMSQHKDRVISVDELMENVWTGKIVTPGTVRRIISLVRKAFSDDAKSPRYIQNIPKKGYVLIAEVDLSPQQALKSNTTKKATSNGTSQYLFKLTPKQIALLTFVPILCVIWLYIAMNPPQKERLLVERVSSKGAEKDVFYDPNNDALFYSHKKEGQTFWQLYAFDLKNNGISQLTQGDFNDSYVEVSPQGDKVSFLRYVDGNFSIITAKLSADKQLSEQQIVHSSNYPIGQIKWNQYGDGLFFSAMDERQVYSVFTLNLVNNKVERLTLPSPNTGGDYLVSVSNDYKHLAVGRLAGNETEIIVYRLDGFSPIFFKKVTSILKSLHWHKNNLLYLKGNSVMQLVANKDWQSELFYEGKELISQLVANHDRVFTVMGDLSNFEIRQLNNPMATDDSSQASFAISSPYRDFSGVYSKVSERIYFLSHRSGLRQIWQWDPTLGYQQLTDLDTYQQIDNLETSYHGDYLTGTIGRSLFLMDVNQKTFDFISPENHYVSRPIWSRDGQWIYYINQHLGENELWRIHTLNRETERIDKNIQSILPYSSEHLFIANDSKSTFIYNILDKSRKVLNSEIDLKLNTSWQLVNNTLYWSKPSLNGVKLMSMPVNGGEVLASREYLSGLNHRFSMSNDGTKVLMNFSSSAQTNVYELQ